jgi:hypothetical protein
MRNDNKLKCKVRCASLVEAAEAHPLSPTVKAHSESGEDIQTHEIEPNAEAIREAYLQLELIGS